MVAPIRWEIPGDATVIHGKSASAEVTIDAEKFLRSIVDDAARGREIEAILRNWLAKHCVFIVMNTGRSYTVAGLDQGLEWFDRVQASTYAEALPIALAKAKERIEAKAK